MVAPNLDRLPESVSTISSNLAVNAETVDMLFAVFASSAEEDTIGTIV